MWYFLNCTKMSHIFYCAPPPWKRRVCMICLWGKLWSNLFPNHLSLEHPPSHWEVKLFFFSRHSLSFVLLSGNAVCAPFFSICSYAILCTFFFLLILLLYFFTIYYPIIFPLQAVLYNVVLSLSFFWDWAQQFLKPGLTPTHQLYQ